MTGGGYDVIIVDDEPVIRMGLTKLLKTSGRPIARIRTAASGREALAAAEADPPDFVFTDIRMPDIDGIELARRLQYAGKRPQVVVISGYSEFQYAQQCLSYGVKEYLLKPVRSDELVRVLDKLIAGAVRGEERAALSVREFDLKAEGIAESVWVLDDAALADALAEWHRYLGRVARSEADEFRLYQEGFDRVVALLNGKGIYPLAGEPFRVNDDAARQFDAAVRRLLQELRVKRKGNPIDPIEAAKEYIDSHLNQEVSLEEVADFLGLNPSYFSQMFKQATQETFVHYRMKKRMELARRLLQDASLKIYDIAQEVGYTDYSHFARTFKRWHGLSPTEFRAKLGIE